jgi:hypothetical protein
MTSSTEGSWKVEREAGLLPSKGEFCRFRTVRDG